MKSFSPREVAALERIEARAFAELFAAAPVSTRTDLGIATAQRGDIGLFATRCVAAPPLNRVLGLGIEEPVTDEELDGALEWMDHHCAPGWSAQVVPGAKPGAFAQRLGARGLTVRDPGWAKLWRPSLPPPAAVASRLEVRAVEQDGAELFGTVVARGFGLPPACAAWFACIVGRKGFTAYLAYDGAEAAASGATFISDGWCWVGFGATLPEFRRRGAQTALLRRRIIDGLAKGASAFVSETGAPPAGEERHHPSLRNLLHAGFEVAYVRPSYKPAPAAQPDVGRRAVR